MILNDYKKIATEIRKTVLSMIFKAQVSHIGSNFSAIDILTVLYSKADFKKDKLVVSKGWIAASIYALGVKHSLIPQKAIETFCDEKSKYIGLIEPLGFFGAEIAGGSMGLGICGAIGLALAKKMKGEDGKVYCLMSDGEMQIGTIWESVLIAKQYNLDNLFVIEDKNLFQAMGKTSDILNVHLGEPFKSCGWMVGELDGHNLSQMSGFFDKLLSGFDDNKKEIKGFPWFIIAHTTKGKGVSFMENSNIWHYKAPNKKEYNLALKELK